MQDGKCQNPAVLEGLRENCKKFINYTPRFINQKPKSTDVLTSNVCESQNLTKLQSLLTHSHRAFLLKMCFKTVEVPHSSEIIP